MRGSHTARGRSSGDDRDGLRPAGPERTRADRPAPPGGTVRRTAARRALLWLVLLACLAFTAWVALGFLKLDHDIDHPGGGFDGWQCSSDSGTCGP